MENKHLVKILNKPITPLTFKHKMTNNLITMDRFTTQKIINDGNNFAKLNLKLILESTNGNYIIHSKQICKQFGADAVLLDSFIFDDNDVELDEMKILEGTKKIKDFVNGDLYKILEYLKEIDATERKNNKTIMKSLFFTSEKSLLLSSNVNVSLKMKNNYRKPIKLICTLYKFNNPKLCVQNFKKHFNVSENYISYNIQEYNIKRVHKLQLPFNGNVGKIIILVQPFNKKCKMEVDGVILDDQNIIAFLDPHINKINCHEFMNVMMERKRIHLHEYNPNIIIVPFSVRSFNSSNYDEGYYTIQSNNVTIEFELRNVTIKENPGSVFIQIWGPKMDEIMFDFDYNRNNLKQ